MDKIKEFIKDHRDKIVLLGVLMLVFVFVWFMGDPAKDKAKENTTPVNAVVNTVTATPNTKPNPTTQIIGDTGNDKYVGTWLYEGEGEYKGKRSIIFIKKKNSKYYSITMRDVESDNGGVAEINNDKLEINLKFQGIGTVTLEIKSDGLLSYCYPKQPEFKYKKISNEILTNLQP